MSFSRAQLPATRRWVIKIGSSLLTADGQGLDLAAISGWVEQLVQLRARGIEVVLVSSGSVAEGMVRLGWSKRPQAVNELQAAAAVGQMGLVQAYESRFAQHDIHTAQILLTHEDLSHRQRYLNARSTLRTLLGLGVVPVVNENDTVAIDEIRLGDNDTLAALVANLVEADVLLILTDQDGLFERDPRLDASAALIDAASVDDERLTAMAGDSVTGLGRGGMRTKIEAARRAARSGTATVIAAGRAPGVVLSVADGAPVGTLLKPVREPLTARKQWLAGQLQVAGTLMLDAGAVRVLRESGRSLLAVGVHDVDGEFGRGELVMCVDGDGARVACGLVNYSASETRRIMGRPSASIEDLLGYIDEPELIHRDNLVLL